MSMKRERISVPILPQPVMPTAYRITPLLIVPGVEGKSWSVATERTFVSRGVWPASILRVTITFLIKAKFVGSSLFWCGSCSWKTGLCIRVYCLPVAQQPATHISEPTPHKQPRSSFFRTGCVRWAWDHHGMEGPPVLTVSWGLDHPRVPPKMGVVFWGGRGVDKVTSRGPWLSVYSWPWCSTRPRQEPSEEGHGARRYFSIIQSEHTFLALLNGGRVGGAPSGIFISQNPTCSRLVT